MLYCPYKVKGRENMDNQKCPNCAAPMILINNRDGTTSYRCNYCGYEYNNRPKNATERVFSFINRAVNALKDDEPFAGASPEKKAELDARLKIVNEKRQAIYDKAMEKKMKAYEKYVEKRIK